MSGYGRGNADLRATPSDDARLHATGVLTRSRVARFLSAQEMETDTKRAETTDSSTDASSAGASSTPQN